MIMTTKINDKRREGWELGERDREGEKGRERETERI